MSTNIKLKRLGNGDAFNWRMTNSSFLIESNSERKNNIFGEPDIIKESEYILFDCGNTVFAKLRELDENGEINLDKLTTIFISHMDDDHIGSLKSLIQYMFYIRKKSMHIVCGETLFDNLYVYLKEINNELINYTIEGKTLFYIETHKNASIGRLNKTKLYFQVFEVEHYQPTYGLKLFDPNGKVNLMISGDTIPSKNILNILLHKTIGTEIVDNANKTVLFHDFSSWDCPEMQKHTCNKALEKTYPKEVIENLNKYHNNEPFLSGWIKMDDDVISSYKIINN